MRAEHRLPYRAQRARPSMARRVWRWTWRLALALLVLAVALVAALRVANPPVTAFMLQAQWEARRDGRDVALDYRWVDDEHIADAVRVAVIAAEDQRFATHRGFDLAQIRNALAQAQGGGRLRGASTLSQQTAKNLFLWPGQSWARKGIEAGFTLLLEALWPKRRILEMYLNVAQFGHGIYGVEAAAQRFFGKPAERLSAAEAALLAAVLPNPRQLRADAPSAYVRSRQRWILTQMPTVGRLEGMDALTR